MAEARDVVRDKQGATAATVYTVYLWSFICHELCTQSRHVCHEQFVTNKTQLCAPSGLVVLCVTVRASPVKCEYVICHAHMKSGVSQVCLLCHERNMNVMSYACRTHSLVSSGTSFATYV